MRSKLPCVVDLFSLMSISSPAAGQLVMGRVRNKQDGVPLRQIEVPVRVLSDQPHPRYPESMRKSGIQGEVLAQFVVDTLGHADMSTFKVLHSTAIEFTNAVRAVLPQMSFFPAELENRKVRQLVQMPFNFCFNGGSPRAPGPDTGAYWWLPKVSSRTCRG